MQTSIRENRTWLIKDYKAEGALHSPKGITLYSYKPYGVQTAVFHSSPGAILCWLKAECRSTFEKTIASVSFSPKASAEGRGYLFLTVISLILL